ncbi:MAG TPA: TIR domain-containing protein, partial [Nitrospira sp.]|nr:TIR domain-containing protein [Nitrospira sp.]
TWGRKFVDWEISSSLRNDSVNRRSGLLVIPLPSRKNSAHLPDRIKDNWVANDEAASYAHYKSYPTRLTSFRADVEAAFQARASKGGLVDNSRELRQRNATS